jgi:hypothetical protein
VKHYIEIRKLKENTFRSKPNLGFVIGYIKSITNHFGKPPSKICLNQERYEALIKELLFKTDPIRIKGVEVIKDCKLPPGKDSYIQS